jgi:hypothetical protein
LKHRNPPIFVSLHLIHCIFCHTLSFPYFSVTLCHFPFFSVTLCHFFWLKRNMGEKGFICIRPCRDKPQTAKRDPSRFAGVHDDTHKGHHHHVNPKVFIERVKQFICGSPCRAPHAMGARGHNTASSKKQMMLSVLRKLKQKTP